ncbi:MAG: methionyl-tRNA formyltransferase [Candidatus Subteraquimicrobiales bacterium]|nr:methionyl-tRNA formyltransferase [Candidatus Subteraquimicrobiales bacterium]
MRVVFFGTPKFAVPALKILDRAGHEAALVITQPDKPVGRGLKPLPSSVKEEAKLLNLPLLQPDNLKIQEVKDKFKEISPEVIVVVAYGKIIPKWLLDLPKYGCINVHASLLPAYRGAAPIQRAIIDGQKTTGITTMLMDEGLDTGDILLQAEIPIFEEETSGELKKDFLSLEPKSF